MFSGEVMKLLGQVISSWQVIAVTVALVLYFHLVFFVSSGYRKPRSLFAGKNDKKRKKIPQGPEEVVSAPGTSVNDELGLDEA